MHETSHATMGAFVRVHLEACRGRPLEILDFGSQMVDGQPLSYRSLLDDPAWHYRGLDIEPGVNVDIVVDDPYDWHGVASESIDLVISGQAFEHVEYFWASMFEIVRVLKPGGLAAIIAPSSGFEHRYPVDCWRFYRDGFDALARYVGCDTIDVFTDWDHDDWADSILVARRPLWSADERRRFAVRAALQRALLDDPTPDPATLGGLGAETGHEPQADGPSGATPSVLATVQRGALSTELGAMRAERVAREREQAVAAERARTAAAEQELAERIEAEAERRTAERMAGITPLRAYGAARRVVSQVVGSRGRAAYRRLRGRG